MYFKQRREAFASMMENQSVAIFYSGIQLHDSEDGYHPFSVHHGFYYLTGLTRDNMIFVIRKDEETYQEFLYIEEPIPSVEKWVGKKTTKAQATEISGIEDVYYLEEFDLKSFVSKDTLFYFDLYKHKETDIDDYNLIKAKEFNKDLQYTIFDAHPLLTTLRLQKDEQEVETIKEAIDITNIALNHVMKTLHPGMMEYQVQANFEYMVALNGGKVGFTTIAGAGYNGTMLHYHENKDVCHENELVLLDLGAKSGQYSADITRTYPISGKFTPLQKEVYNIVLDANKAVAKTAKPGITLNQLNDITKKILAEGMIRLGFMKEESELIKYYMHGVSHHLGLDVHDSSFGRDVPLEVGAVITNEPGLYIEEESIGIRIEDDLLITEDGCIVLSDNIIKEVDEIEAYMAK